MSSSRFNLTLTLYGLLCRLYRTLCLHVPPIGCEILFLYTVISLLCEGELICYDAIVSLFFFLNCFYGSIMEPFIHWYVSFEVNNGQMKPFAVKLMPK